MKGSACLGSLSERQIQNRQRMLSRTDIIPPPGAQSWVAPPGSGFVHEPMGEGCYAFARLTA